MRVIRKRGSNSVTFVFGEKTDENKARALESFRGNIMKYLSYKDKAPEGGSIPPQEVIIRIKHGYPESTVRRNKYSERYYEFTTTANFFVDEKFTKPTPVKLLEHGADIIRDFSSEMIRKSEVNPERNYELRDDYRIFSITYSWVYLSRI